MLPGYSVSNGNGLAHAYATIVRHRQGSEYPAVIILCTTSSWTKLQRNLLYTGITGTNKLMCERVFTTPLSGSPISVAVDQGGVPQVDDPVFHADRCLCP
jgi:hypothetical protein